MDAYDYINHLELSNEIDSWNLLGRSRQYVIDRLLFRYELVEALKWVFLRGDQGLVDEFQKVVKYVVEDEEFGSKEERGEGYGGYSASEIIEEVSILRREVDVFDIYEGSWSDEVLRIFERYRLFLPFAALKAELALQMSDITKQNGVWFNEL